MDPEKKTKVLIGRAGWFWYSIGWILATAVKALGTGFKHGQSYYRMWIPSTFFKERESD